MKTQNNLIRYREIYTYLNEETLSAALKNGHDHFVVGMLREGLNRVAVGTILISLGETLNPKYLELLWHYTKNSDPYIRESAYIALVCFPEERRPEYDYFLNQFKNKLASESSPGVIKQIEGCIECIEREINWR